MTQVDKATKVAALLPQHIHKTPNLTSTKRRIQVQLQESVLSPPSPEKLNRLMKMFGPTATFKNR